jgi:endonuclease/exonuclease/phosphatase family metal-dependent hydrolase
MPTAIRLLPLLLLAAAAGNAEPLRVMSFNVRMPSPGDGDNRWEQRRDLMVETVRAMDPDLMGTQELFKMQGDYLVEKLPAYRWFGVSRRGNDQDEHMGVFYKPGKLQVVESGNFWLSETPDKPGSMSWNVTLPRMVTWALFEVRATRQRFYYYNTHFPHRREDAAARLECARLIAARAAKLPKDVPFLLTGDFNSPAEGDTYNVFAGALQDAWLTAAHRFGPTGTFNGFKGTSTGPRIDWIFYRGMKGALQAHTVQLNENGRYPSDHFPVFAVLDLR